MSQLSLMVMAALALVSTVRGAEQGAHLFILSGQSNMVGMNPKQSFTPAVEAALGKERVIVVKHASSGQPIRRWYKTWEPKPGAIVDGDPARRGDLYDALMEKVNQAIEGRTLQTVTFIWMQGERDAREKHGEVYGASLRGVIDQLEKDLGRDDVSFVIGRLSDFDMENRRYPHWTMVRDAQVEMAEADVRGSWVDTDDLNDGKNRAGKDIRNDLHYSVEGYRTLGERFAAKAIERTGN